MNESDWCDTILTTKLTKKEIQDRVLEIEQFSRESYPEDGCFSIKWLRQVVYKIDELWYGSQMMPTLDREYGGLVISIDSGEEKVAGYIQEVDDSIVLHMNRDLFYSLFKKREKGYHSGGLLCSDRLVCMLHVLLHETVHIILTLCEKLGHQSNIRDHGKAFNQIIRNLFGQTDSQHGLIPGYSQDHDLDTIKQRVRKGSIVDVFMNNQTSRGKVVYRGRKWVEVDCGSVVYKVHIGLIKLVD
jgi:hypothetical protein